MSGSPWTAVGRAFRRTALPLTCYYAVTLAIPLAHGAGPSGTFVRHALVVLVVPPVAIVLACAARAVAQALTSASHDEAGHPRRQNFLAVSVAEVNPRTEGFGSRAGGTAACEHRNPA